MILQAITAIAALGAAACWLKVAATRVPPRQMTWDMTNFDWLAGPLERQAWWNSIGALFAAVAAGAQVLSWLTGWT